MRQQNNGELVSKLVREDLAQFPWPLQWLYASTLTDIPSYKC